MEGRNFLNAIFGLSGKTALVTGGATGIGFMIAEALSHAGARVLIASRKADDCKRAADELHRRTGANVEGFGGDVGSEAGLDQLGADVAERCDMLHILINNAGKSWGDKLESFPYTAWSSIFSVNVAGPFALVQRVLPLLQLAADDDDPARIVNVGSVMGSQPIGGRAYSYAASKAAIHHLTRILANELSAVQINVNAIAPGPFQSRMTSFATEDEEKRQLVAENVPLGRIGRAEDIAGVILFLCGRGGAYTTGGILPIDGGIGVQHQHVIFGGIAE